MIHKNMNINEIISPKGVNYQVKNQESYSRLLAITRALFNGIYIFVPYFFALIGKGIVFFMYSIINFFVVLTTGSIPSEHQQRVKEMLMFNLGFELSMVGMTDEYPAFNGLNNNFMTLEFEERESMPAGELLIKTFLGSVLLIPHSFLYLFNALWVVILAFISFFLVLFTGKIPQSWFNFVIGYQRRYVKMHLWKHGIIEKYPTFDKYSGV